MKACLRGHGVEALLEHGADPALTDADGWTALQLALAAGHAEIVERLQWASKCVRQG